MFFEIDSDEAKSIERILMTRKGSRVMRPKYGSDLYKYRDRSMDDETRLGIIETVFEAVKLNEPRVRIKRVKPESDDANKFKIRIEV